MVLSKKHTTKALISQVDAQASLRLCCLQIPTDRFSQDKGPCYKGTILQIIGWCNISPGSALFICADSPEL